MVTVAAASDGREPAMVMIRCRRVLRAAVAVTVVQDAARERCLPRVWNLKDFSANSAIVNGGEEVVD